MFTEQEDSKIEKERMLQDVQALVELAQKIPRDEDKAINRIIDAAKRKKVAENAIYGFPVANGQIIKGPSIRAAETIARYWGNFDFGIKETFRDNLRHISEVTTYAWDLEMNTRQVKTIVVSHFKDERVRPAYLKDSREINEKISNEGARSLRACILGLIPNDIVDDFISACEKTIAGDKSVPLVDRVIETVLKFEEIGVSQALIEKRFGLNFDLFEEKQLVELQIIYRSIKDKFQPIEAFFDTADKNSRDTAVINVFEEGKGVLQCS